MKLHFTEEDSDRANVQWNANCGPHAIAAALAIPLDFVRKLMPDFEAKGYSNPTMIGAALGRAGINYKLAKGLKTQELAEGINRIQWEGRWLRPGVPPAAAYYYTHWVAFAQGHVFCTCMPGVEWWPLHTWRRLLEVFCSDEKYDGWHVTHHYRFEVLAK